MTSGLLSLRALVGVATVAAALLVGLVPDIAQAAPARSRSAVAIAPTVKVLPVLTRGSTGPFVKTVQTILGVKATGYYGLRTVAAVKKFQASVKLPANGVVGPATWAALKRKAAASRARTGAATVAPVGDPTMTSAARSTRTARDAIPPALWSTSAHGRAIVRRESGGRCSVVSAGGLYRGKWQMSSALWRAYGGTAFATTADRATCAEQDQVAYKVWLTSWWRPWGG